MGVYLNSRKPGAVYRRIAQSQYFVDKTALLEELFPSVEGNPAMSGDRNINCICITRPRRFGKTVMVWDMWIIFFIRTKRMRML